MQSTTHTVTVRWNGTDRTLLVEPTVNVRDTFGAAAFLVAEPSQSVVSLDPAGRPLAPLDAATTYSVMSGSSAQLRKQLQQLKGQLAQLRNESSRLRERVAKFELAHAEQLKHLHKLVGAADGLPHVAAAAAAAAAALDAGASDTRGADGASSPSPPPSSAAAAAAAGSWDTAAWSGWPYVPIGRLRSCFVEKNGTPRQGCVCPSSVATLRVTLPKHLNAAHALEGLAHFSHVWLLFVFDRNRGGTKSKVSPPRLDGVKTGLFATRTPHRPNNLGLSLMRLDGVEKETLRLSGVDLVDGTPIIDVKPYLPFSDSAADARVAPWFDKMPTPDLAVEFAPAALDELAALAPSLSLLPTVARARAAITEVLVADPRSVHWRQQRAELEYGFSIDTLNVVCRFDGGVATVTHIQHVDACDRSHVPEPPAAGGAAASADANG